MLVSCPAFRLTRKPLQRVARHGFLISNTYRTGLATSSVAQNTTIPSDFLSLRQETLTLVHKVSKCIPATLSLKADSDSTRSVELWNRILSRIYQGLAHEHAQPIKIVVCPLDEWSASQDLVMALLTDPFSSDENYTRNLNDRWKPCDQEQLHITYDPHSTTIDPASLTLPSAYLTQFSAPIELIELRRPPTTQGKPLPISQILDNTTVAEADIPILVFNPLVTSLSTISASRVPSNSILVLSASVPQHELDEILKQHQSHTHSSSSSEPLQFVAVDPGRAANAIHILRREPNSVAAIQRYQDDVLGSQISHVTNALRTKLSRAAQNELALHTISDGLNTCHSHLRSTKNDLDAAFLDSCTLRDRIEECTARAENDVLERGDDSQKLASNKVIVAIGRAQKDLIHTMDLLTWWRLLWRVDEISTIVTAAVQTVWCQDLEKELILETGKLSALQRETSASAFELLSKHAVIQTAILQNQILQLEASPTYRLSPVSLTKPIHSRRDQIIQYPTTRLHIAGQKVVLGMGGGVATGVGVGWAGWLGWLVGSGDGLFGFLGMEPGTAIGVSMLVAVASIRWSIGSWEKAKKRWWQDWTRVGEGLERDLKDTLDRTMRRQVTVVAMTACDGVSELVSKREQEIVAARKELDELQNSLDHIAAKLSSTKTR